MWAEAIFTDHNYYNMAIYVYITTVLTRKLLLYLQKIASMRVSF